jgi:hypothetical protein
MEFVRREAEVKKAEREEMIERIKAIEAVPAVPAFVVEPAARAREDDGTEDDEPPQPRLLVPEEQFDRYLLGDATSRRSRLDALLTMRIAEADQMCGLTAAQKKKLQLAGHGDIKRLLDRVEEKRGEFQLARDDPNHYREFLRTLSPLRFTIQAGAFGDGSLFSKVLKTTLNADQVARHEKALRERWMPLHRSTIKQVVETLNHALRLNTEQRRRLLEVLWQGTRPPKNSGPYDYHVIMLQLAKLPEARVKPIFSDTQWELLGRLFFDRARRMEPQLAAYGFLPDVAVEREGALGAEAAPK